MARPRLGLCCQFAEQPIKFRTTTAMSLLLLGIDERRQKLSRLCLENAAALLASIEFCAAHAIGCFRISSNILPVSTHPQVGYSLADLPEGASIVGRFRQCGELARRHGIRTVFHPDQFVVLNSPREEVVTSSLRDLESQAALAELVGVDVINIHGGGGYGDKPAALERFARNLDRLSDGARARLTIENDDRVFTPADLLPLCRASELPLVYDAHHHRCRPDGLSVATATEEALETWNREPLFHISSPLEGWGGRSPHRHQDYIDIDDFPDCWRSLALTVEVEAKAKELAVLRLARELQATAPHGSPAASPPCLAAIPAQSLPSSGGHGIRTHNPVRGT